MPHLARLVLAGCCTLALELGATSAHADTAECNAAYVETQQLQRSGQLRSARVAALSCAQDTCSVTVRRDCGAWLEDIIEATPSIVIEARDDAGNELATVRAFVDDELLAEHLDGQALPIDPGAHELRFEHGERVQIQRLLALEGQAYRRVSVRFGPARTESVGGLSSTAAPASSREAPASSLAIPASSPAIASPESLETPDLASIPLATYLLGGAGVASLSAFAILATSAYASERELRDECGRACGEARVESVRERYLIADVALGLGISSLVAAGALWAFAPAGQAPSQPKPDLRLDWGASSVSLSGSF